MDTDVTQTPSKKRRKGSLGKEILPLQDTKRSMIVLKEEDEEKWMDKELWLIQLPTNVSLNQLNGQEVDICPGSTSTLRLDSDHNKSSKTKAFEVNVQSLDDPMSMTSSDVILTPSTKPGRLKTGPVVQKCLCIHQTVEVPSVELPSSSSGESKVDVPTGLKQRWKPFGYRRPLIEKPDTEIQEKHKGLKRTQRES